MVARRPVSSAPGLALLFLAAGGVVKAQPFQFPTANHALYENGGEERFFVGTVGKPWTSGMFGCVRSDGMQIHEGLDIKCLQRDKRGEPADPVLATADGVVAYINAKASLSNYGNYIVIKHQIEGLEIYSIYAHLQSVRPGLKAGQAVKQGENIAVMGRTSNTRETISKERAHVHFELDFLANDRFPEWFVKNSPGERNDHGMWNGQNMNAIDARKVLLEEQRKGAAFSLLEFVRGETELCRVFVRDTNFPWLARYPALISRNPLAEKEGVAGYELAIDFNGVVITAIPRAASEIKSKARYVLLSVNETEQKKNPARGLVAKRAGRWELTDKGLRLLGLLTF